MVYVYRKIIGKKPYYYLRASEKKGSRMLTKDVAYLGSSLAEVKHALENLPKHKEKIRKAYKTIHHFLESNHYLEKIAGMKIKEDAFIGRKLHEIEACKLHYHSVFDKLDDTTKQETYKNFVIEFAYNTTSIEGNTITLQQARNLLEEGLTPKDKTLREVYDVQNTEKVFFEVLHYSGGLSHELIEKIHAGLMDSIDKRTGYRTTDVRVIKAGFKATPAPFVKTDMDILLKWYHDNKQKLHPLVIAAIFHHKFEKIHPFMDGNGRAGRMLLNSILMKKGYPPLIIHRKFRSAYLEVLRKADTSVLTMAPPEQYSSLVGFIADEMVGSYWSIFL